MIGDYDDLATVDVYANGYVTKPGWGDDFGTSYASPRVFAEIINAGFELLGSTIEDSEELPENTNLTNEQYTQVMDFFVDYISRPVEVLFGGVNDYYGPISVLNDTISDHGFQPLALNYDDPGAQYLTITNAREYLEPSNHAAEFQMTFGSDGDTFWPGDNFILSNLVFEDADGTSNSSSNYEILWYRHPENTLSEASSPILLGGASGYTNYYATTDDIGSYISVKFQFTDDLGNLEFVDFTTDSAIQAAPNSQHSLILYLFMKGIIFIQVKNLKLTLHPSLSQMLMELLN